MNKLFSISLLLWLLFVLNVYGDSPTVRRTANGPVEGIVQTSSLGQKFYAFKGIPFAEPPITGTDPYTGENVDRRFKAPEPLQRKWTDVLKVHKISPSCAPSGFTPSSNLSEDCLYLNIYVPAGGKENKTVLVWIYGGAFSVGDASDSVYAPDFLLAEDNVVVTLNYRVGIFGFLNFGTGEYTGNMGLKDQQLAIKWTYENIEHFSGNKHEILLFGQSAGGASVHFQMLNEESRKYFNRAIAMSSSAFSYNAIAEAKNINKIQECSKIHDEKKLLEYLKTADKSILAKCYTFKPDNDRSITWLPTIESSTTVGAFLTKTPEEIYQSDAAPIMDAMFSFTNKEYIVMHPELIQSTEPLIKDDWRETNMQLPFRGFNKDTHPQIYKMALKLLKKEYFPDTTNTVAIARENIDLMSDLTISESVLRAAVFQTKANKQGIDKNMHRNTFIYRFSLDSIFNLMTRRRNVRFHGAGHADDVCYFFHCHILDPAYDNHLNSKDSSYDDIIRMVKIITNFAKTGNPSIEGDTAFVPCKSEKEIFSQEISNDRKTSVRTDIKEVLHYDTWRVIEEMYRKSKVQQS